MYFIVLLPFMKTFPMRVMWDQIAPYFLQYSDLLENKNEFTKQVTKFYLKGESTREASLDKFSQVHIRGLIYKSSVTVNGMLSKNLYSNL